MRGCWTRARAAARSRRRWAAPSSTVSNEVTAHRFVVAPKARAGEPAPEGLGDACERLRSWPACCNGCRRRSGYGCGRRPRVAHVARLAQEAAERELVESRRGVDEDGPGFRGKVAVVRSCLARGLSPRQIAAPHPELGLSASTIHRWVGAGYGDMTNMEPRRKVGYKRRRRKAPRRLTRHDARRSHAALSALPDGERAAAWEMDTVEGREGDPARPLTLPHRPSRFQLAPPMASQTCGEAKRALGLVREALGGEEGACEKSHVEMRKLLPKGRGVSFDRLTAADCALVMSQVSSEPRGELAFMSPARMLGAALGDDARALMEAFGVEGLDRDELDLTPGRMERARAERGDAPLAD